MIREGNDSQKTTLDDNAAIYAKRDERSAKAKFKDLHGKEKWQFFRDYMLGKLIAALITLGLVGYFIYSVAAPKPEVVYNVSVIDSTMSEQTRNTFLTTLEEAFITDPDHQTVTLDTDLYVTADEYSARTKLMTFVGAGEIDCLIMPEQELYGYGNSGMYEDFFMQVSPETLKKNADRLIYGSEILEHVSVDLQKEITEDTLNCDSIYAIDVTDYLTELTGYEQPTRYVMVCLINSSRMDRFETMVNLMCK